MRLGEPLTMQSRSRVREHTDMIVPRPSGGMQGMEGMKDDTQGGSASPIIFRGLAN